MSVLHPYSSATRQWNNFMSNVQKTHIANMQAQADKNYKDFQSAHTKLMMSRSSGSVHISMPVHTGPSEQSPIALRICKAVSVTIFSSSAVGGVLMATHASLEVTAIASGVVFLVTSIGGCIYLCASGNEQEEEKTALIDPKMQIEPEKVNVDTILLTVKFKEQVFNVEMTITFDGKKIKPTDKMREVERQKGIYTDMVQEIAKKHEPDYTESLGLLKELTSKGFIFEGGVLPHGDKTTSLWNKFLERLQNPG